MYRYYPDCNGDTIKLWDDDGRIATTSRAPWHPIQRMKTRDDDVLICAYPRSGTHWVWEIVHQLLTGADPSSSSSSSSSPPLDMKDCNMYLAHAEHMHALPSPRVLCTHRQFHDLPSNFILNKTKTVVVVRDPRDVCVSAYNASLGWTELEYKGKFDGFVDLFLQGKMAFNTWSRWILSYEKGLKEHPELNVHVVYFEQMKKDPVSEIRRLAEFLGVESSLVDTVAEKTQFSNMKAAKLKPNDKYAHLFTGTDSSEVLLRKGTSGDWKNWFSDEMAANFEKVISEQLGRDSMKPLL